ncbi:hypothetical protein ASD15_02085 [Massilia sp. Root351]|jgi:transcriptional regulator|uniref:FMN-binding negative transcriptional regulator n=1 Tax=Massilia sp. Root351 TaxID=1736522 RepID=UPI00070BE11D|nr:FMN-binding negative transcriptional regulator [Massilia sp. Root351]KQV90877.1 hypothetical protein ASD15_02085 [Massilia sp. Root351]
MYHTSIFRPAELQPIEDLVKRHPLALLVSHGDAGSQATPLPLVLQRTEGGGLEFIGHLSTHNPQLASLRQSGRALLVFTGAQGYISSAWLRDRRNAPTWNYEMAQFDVDLEFGSGPDATRAALQALVDQMDAGEACPWRLAESPRYEVLSQYIVPFRARVRTLQGQFKLGQGETPEVLADSMRGLLRQGGHGSLELAGAMAAWHQLDLPLPAAA